ncbi:MAG: MoaD/ThiS family protein [Candidatus Thorarchaeota archaeon]
MKVGVKLYAALQEYSPPGTELGEAFPIELEGSTVGDLVNQLGIKEEHAKIIIVNGIRIDDLSHHLNEDDQVVIFPPIGGG